mgnify:CR=1 FL=1
MSSITALIRLKQRRAPKILNKEEKDEENVICNIRNLILDDNSILDIGSKKKLFQDNNHDKNKIFEIKSNNINKN